MSSKVKNKLLEKAKTLPRLAGCYLLKGRGIVLYVGKAKNLKSRVSNYFSSSEKSPKTEILVSHVDDFDFILADSEAEAFVLENNLIKKYSPKYNIRLKDDKSYPYAVIDKREPFPRLEYKRKVKRKKNVEVFGPFTTGSNISNVLKILIKSFELRDCSLKEMRSRKEACLLYQMKQCSAPCVSKISEREYEKSLKFVLDFFKGKGSRAIKFLKAKMVEAALREEFERAAQLRDKIEVLAEFLEISTQKNAELKKSDENLDVFAFYRGENEIEISIYMIRNGLLLGHKNFNFIKSDLLETDEDEVMSFLYQYYQQGNDSLPAKLVLKLSDKNLEVLQGSFSKDNLLTSIEIIPPDKKYKQLYDLTSKHAKETQRVRVENQDSPYIGLSKLQELLNLKERPVTLECYDVAIFQGTSPTAAQVVFVNGSPDKTKYRHYHLKEREEGNNDFAMMREVLERRIKHGDLPDVFIVDGGKGQVSIFETVLKERKIEVPVVGIAKQKGQGSFRKQIVKKTDERLIIPGRMNPYILEKNRSLFRIIVSMRDEAHRFSRRLHHKQEKKRFFNEN